MLPDDENRFRIWPYAPFTEPLKVPSQGAYDEPQVCLKINMQYIPYLLGAMQVFMYTDAWDTDRETAEEVIRQWELVRLRFMEATAEECTTTVTMDSCNFVPVGGVIMWAGADIPDGWLRCSGDSYLKTAYPALYAAIGGLYGQTSTHFNVPDFDGRVPLGTGTADYGTAYPLPGVKSGSATQTLTAANLPAHDHTIPGRNNSALGASGRFPVTNGTGTVNDAITTGSAGSGTAHNNMQPYTTMGFIIRAEDVECIELVQGVPGAPGAPGAPGVDGAPGAKGDKGDTGEKGDTGATGLKGDTGETGQPGDCPDCDTREAPENPQPDTAGLRCSIAINVTNELRRLWLEAYEDSNGFVSDYVAGILTAAGLVALVIPGINIAVAAISLLAGVLVKVAQLAEMAESNAFDDPAEERFRCALFCILNAHNTDILTTAILDEWQAEIRADALTPEAFSSLIADIVDTIPQEQWQWIAYASSEVNPAACDCGCCSLHINAAWGGQTEEDFEFTMVSGNTAQFPGLDPLNVRNFVTRRDACGFTLDDICTSGEICKAIGVERFFTEPITICKTTGRMGVGLGNCIYGLGNTRIAAIYVQTPGGSTWELLDRKQVNIHQQPEYAAPLWEGSMEINAIAFVGYAGGSVTSLIDLQIFT